jgi:four helix bundle protein
MGGDKTVDKSEPDNYLKHRSRQFGLRVIRLTESLPKSAAAQVIARQLLRSALSVGANYRAAKRARSNADFISKMGIVEEEADESLHWMEMLVDAGIADRHCLEPLMKEAGEITAMVVASIRTARSRNK